MKSASFRFFLQPPVIRSSVLSFCLLLPSLAAVGQSSPVELQFRHFSARNGLAHSTVWGVTQDRRGFIWISTEGGLQRFDGYELVRFSNDPEDPFSLSASETFDLYADRRDRMWMATRNRGVAVYDSSEDRFRTFHLHDVPPLNPGDACFREGPDQSLWLMTPNRLLRFDEQDQTFRAPRIGSPTEEQAALRFRPRTFVIAQGRLTWADPQGRLFSWRPTTDGKPPHAVPWPESIERSPLLFSYLDSQDRIWIGSEAGDLLRLRLDDRPSGWLAESYPNRFDKGIGSIAGYDNDLWLGSSQGALLRLPGLLTAELSDPPPAQRVGLRPGDPTGLSTDRVDALWIDRSGGLWTSSRAGVDRTDLSSRGFRGLGRRIGGDWGLEGDHVTAIGEDRRGNRWLAGNGWLTRWNPENREFQHAALSHEGLDIGGVKTIFEDRFRTLWLGAERGLFRINTKTLDIERVDRHAPHQFQTRLVFEDSKERLWVAGEDLRRIRSDGSVEATYETRFVLAAAEDQTGRLWLGTAHGVQVLTHDGNIVSPAGALGSIQDEVLSLLIDRRGNLWMGLRDGGLVFKDLSSGSIDDSTIQRFHIKSGLANPTVAAIIEDGAGSIWLGTQQGLSRLDIDSLRFSNFSTADGIHGNSFFTGTALQSRTGELLFGGSGGLTFFDPQALGSNPHPPTVVLTGLSLDGVAVSANDPTGVLARSIATTDSIVLDHRHRSFEISFTALHFSSPDKIRYLYRLRGFEESWNEAEAAERSARYTNVDPGLYTFEMQAASPDGVWNPRAAEMQITIEASPWLTPWAYTFYAFLTLTAFSGFIIWQQHRYNQQRRINVQLRSAERRKNHVIANTSHELRTPLYGITGLAESLLQNKSDALPTEARRDISLIAESGRRLSRLVEDILDFSHIRKKEMKLDIRPTDLRPILEAVAGLCRPAAHLKGVELHLELPSTLPKVAVDEDRIFQVLSNLVENAVKFTEKGSVRVAATALDPLPDPRNGAGSPGKVRLTISDTGIGLEPGELGRLRQVFEQGDSSEVRSFGGTGIGLTIADRLLQLHGSPLQIETKLREGCTCWFDLPTAPEDARRVEKRPAGPHFRPRHRDTKISVNDLDLDLTASVSASDEHPIFQDLGLSKEARSARILAVDDEPTNLVILANYLCLSTWQVTTAQSGAEALKEIEHGSFDLVLLDVMMPELSGYEVCERLRESYSMWELPVIFLSAKTKTEDAQVGLSLGANDYLTKPVTQNELLTRIRPHLELVFAYRRMAERIEEKLSQLKILGGLLPICSVCKKIRDDQGYWEEIEQYIDEHSEAAFSHGVCPSCSQEFLREAE